MNGLITLDAARTSKWLMNLCLHKLMFVDYKIYARGYEIARSFMYQPLLSALASCGEVISFLRVEEACERWLEQALLKVAWGRGGV